MISKSIVVQQLVLLLKAKGISEIFVSPGSRNAPLSISLNRDSFFNCKVIPDERVSGFMALGAAQATGNPVALICTSGSALLNYYPAVAEAHYQQLPLIVISADRPAEWVDHGDGQTIRQVGALKNHMSYEVQLNRNPVTETERWYNEREINLAINTAITIRRPVHINVPLQEPLYELTDKPAVEPKVIDASSPKKTLSVAERKKLDALLAEHAKVMVLVGQHVAQPALAMDLGALADEERIVVLGETTSNVHGKGVISTIDRTIDGFTDAEKKELAPDCLITLGGAIISKKVKFWLRSNRPKAHIHIGAEPLDMFMALTHHLDVDSTEIIEPLQQNVPAKEWVLNWQRVHAQQCGKHERYLMKLPFSDYTVYKALKETIPSNAIVQQGNSSVVRYMQLFDWSRELWFYGNRGTSGIEGSSSTAVGYANYTNRPVVLLTGDISFFYDSNAYFHRHVPNNLKIILLNNGGGSIFRIIDGPSRTEELDTFFESAHSFEAAGISQSYGLRYAKAENEAELIAGLKDLFANSSSAALLEVKTPRTENDVVLREYFEYLKKA
jgi:2-succinyl-5-enolpyruvyl-6-hydroxy-3-cyclohexene-1-carboxylate synthase